MDLLYADPTLAPRPRLFSLRAAVFTALWLLVTVGPPFLYAGPVHDLYRHFKTELPAATQWVLDFQAWNARFGWVWLLLPLAAGVVSVRVGRDVTDSNTYTLHRLEKLYIGLLLTLAAMLITVYQMAVIWLPWMSVTWSVSGGGRAGGSA